MRICLVVGGGTRRAPNRVNKNSTPRSNGAAQALNNGTTGSVIKLRTPSALRHDPRRTEFGMVSPRPFGWGTDTLAPPLPRILQPCHAASALKGIPATGHFKFQCVRGLRGRGDRVSRQWRTRRPRTRQNAPGTCIRLLAGDLQVCRLATGTHGAARTASTSTSRRLPCTVCKWVPVAGAHLYLLRHTPMRAMFVFTTAPPRGQHPHRFCALE